MRSTRRVSVTEARERMESDDPFADSSIRTPKEKHILEVAASAQPSKTAGRKGAAKKGAYYKARSKEWLENKTGKNDKGIEPDAPRDASRPQYQVADMEVVKTIFTPRGKMSIKRDQLGSDLLYLDLDDGTVAFLQVKSGDESDARLNRDALKGFAPHRFPVHSKQVVHIWRRGAKKPLVTVYDLNEPVDADV